MNANVATLPPPAGPAVPVPTASSAAVMDLPPELVPNIDHLVFENGKPAQSNFVERQMHLLVEPLYSSWPGPPETGKFAAMSNVGLFPEVKQTNLVPDGLLSCGVEVHRDPHPRNHRSYLVWEYGKPPQSGSPI